MIPGSQLNLPKSREEIKRKERSFQPGNGGAGPEAHEENFLKPAPAREADGILSRSHILRLREVSFSMINRPKAIALQACLFMFVHCPVFKLFGTVSGR